MPADAGVRGAARNGAAAAAAMLLALAAGCADADESGATVTREVRGDTTIIRTAGPGPWGETELVEELRIGELAGADEYTFGRISDLAVDEEGTMYVLDSQAREVRVYDADGSFVKRFGREGEGPGEFRQPSQLAFLPDGRLVVRDYANARLNVFSAAGEPLDTWTIPGSFGTTAPMFVDQAGHVYTDIVADRADDGTFVTGLLHLDSTGAVVDTLRRPFGDYERPRLVAVNVTPNGRSTSFGPVPFWPGAVTTLNRNGEFVGGTADAYALTRWGRDGTVQRIERVAPRVPVEPAEAAAEVEGVTRSMRNTQSDWKWDGPQPPAEKPAFKQIRVAADGRIWVQTSQPAQRVAPEPDAEPDAQGRPPLDRWVEPAVYDVFEEDGSFLGTVRLPERFTPLYFRGDRVWGIARDEYDVQYVTRWRVGASA